MAFIKASSPHAHQLGNTGTVMLMVLVACIPGIAALTIFFGAGVLVNIVLTSLFCLGLEAIVLKLRHRKLSFYLKDFSAILTAVLLAIALPPYAPWWLLLCGAFFAIIVAKQLYGGLGFNPFNPAMIGYIVLLISFPLEMSQWLSPEGFSHVSIGDGLAQVFSGQALSQIDGYTAATPLDVIKQNNTLLLSDVYTQNNLFSHASWAGLGWEWVNVGFLIGGLFLLYKKIFTWHAPVCMLLALTVLSALFYDGGSSTSTGSPLLHLFSGGTMLGAFFIITDPVTSSTSNRGRMIYGSLAGVLIFLIRAWGNYPDAIAFAVLLMNFAAPFIDYYTRPRTYGHEKAHIGINKKP